MGCARAASAFQRYRDSEARNEATPIAPAAPSDGQINKIVNGVLSLYAVKASKLSSGFGTASSRTELKPKARWLSTNDPELKPDLGLECSVLSLGSCPRP
eukprot:TRINITY_DN11715_c0_g1_i1.p7 TRINITY_DN11715_c0_g1~~TRINITY_DN11715_c0_g1_i1.p7  ORF type:complete len:100 (+),score=4.54 TRINITY_DN11715_c0_g1_i1:1327-1626(+)